MTLIRFGTDGWRAVIGDDFVPENIKKVVQAFADLYTAMPEAGRPVVVGYDRRKASPESAEIIASVLLGNGIPAMLSRTFCPTPTVSWMVKTKGCAAGIMVTASHNPPKWNGIKFKESYGGAASGDYCRPIEERIAENDRSGKAARTATVAGNQKLVMFDAYGEYLDQFGKFVDLELIKRQKYRIVVDPLYGAGTGFFPKLLGDCVSEIHTAADTNFGGLNPEPIPPYINELISLMKKGGHDVGLVTDGDADRAGCVDEKGSNVTTHEIFALLIKHAVENKKWTGKIIKSISTTMMIDRLGKKYGLEVKTVPVGFKHISPAMKEPGVLIGGEESGGFGFPRHIPERDGVFSGLLLLELMATTKRTMSELVADIQREVGPTKYRRIDMHLTQQEITTAREKMTDLNIPSVDGVKMVRRETMDGIHFLFEDESWLLFRASGTEPLVRIYAEAPTMDRVEEMLKIGRRAIGL